MIFYSFGNLAISTNFRNLYGTIFFRLFSFFCHVDYFSTFVFRLFICYPRRFLHSTPPTPLADEGSTLWTEMFELLVSLGANTDDFATKSPRLGFSFWLHSCSNNILTRHTANMNRIFCANVDYIIVSWSHTSSFTNLLMRCDFPEIKKNRIEQQKN